MYKGRIIFWVLLCISILYLIFGYFIMALPFLIAGLAGILDSIATENRKIRELLEKQAMKQPEGIPLGRVIARHNGRSLQQLDVRLKVEVYGKPPVLDFGAKGIAYVLTSDFIEETIKAAADNDNFVIDKSGKLLGVKGEVYIQAYDINWILTEAQKVWEFEKKNIA